MHGSLAHKRTTSWRVLRILGAIGISSSALLVLLILWQLSALAAKSMFFPPPTVIIARAYGLWLSGPASHLFLGDAVFRDVIPSLGRLMTAWSLAVVVGVGLGIAAGRSHTVSYMVSPAIEFLRALPSPALIPIFLILLGTETTMRIALITFGSIWPILLNSIEGMQTIDPVQMQTARIYKLPRHATIMQVMLPAALPKILAGMRISLAIAVILMVVSELVASSNGIGHQISNAQQLFRLPDMWAGIVLLALIGFTLDRIFSRVEQSLLRWQPRRHKPAEV
jgi:ABC-type nitrate/sulfonate/bicarbonate transport system permease component